MATLNPTDGFCLFGWMVTELHLDVGDLFAFALVHQFCQSNAGKYTGNTSYLSAWTGWTEKTSRNHLARLVEMGLIKEMRGRCNNTPFCHYELAESFIPKHPVKITGSPGKNFQNHPVKITVAPGKNYRGIYNIDNKDKDIIPPISPQGESHRNDDCIVVDNDNRDSGPVNIQQPVLKRARRQQQPAFVPPTPEQVAEYAASLGFRSPEGFGHFYVGHFENEGWIRKNGEPMRNWKNNVREVWMLGNRDKDFSDYVPGRPDAAGTEEDNVIARLRQLRAAGERIPHWMAEHERMIENLKSKAKK